MKMMNRRCGLPPIEVQEDRCVDLSEHGLTLLEQKNVFIAVEKLVRVLRKQIPSAYSVRPPVSIEGASKVAFHGIAGQVNLAGYTFLIRPKYALSTEWLPGWSRMLTIQSSKNKKRKVVVLHSEVSASSNQAFYVDIVADWYAESLEEALRFGPLSIYCRRKAASSYVKGRIMVDRTLRLSLSGKPQFFCSFSAHRSRNELTGLLSLCCVELAGQVRSPSLRRRLEGLAEKLGPAIDLRVALPTHIKRTVQYTQGYGALLDFAFTFLASRKLREFRGASNPLMTSSVLADMDVCFESFVSEITRRLAKENGYLHKEQSARLLFRRIQPREGKPAEKRFTRPDVVLSDREFILCIDAKYKGRAGQLDGSFLLPISDLYQLFSACIAFNCSHGLFLQPLTDSEGFELEIWESVIGTQIRKKVIFGTLKLDINCLQEQNGIAMIKDQIRDAIAQIREAG